MMISSSEIKQINRYLDKKPGKKPDLKFHNHALSGYSVSKVRQEGIIWKKMGTLYTAQLDYAALSKLQLEFLLSHL